MADILSPEEIEALLTSLVADGAGEAIIDTSAEHSAGVALRTVGSHASHQHGGDGRYEVYDFRRPDKLSKEQLRKLHMLHDTCARNASSALASYLRTPVQVELISVEQVPYEEYLRSINQSVFCILSLSPLSGQAVLEIEFALVFSMLDRMLGGPGKSINRMSLTEIETPLCMQLAERVLASLKMAWEAVVIVNPDIDSIETSAQFVQVAAPNDIAVTILFEVKVGHQRGAMSLCIPYQVLKPITQKLSAQKWLASAGRKRSEETRRSLSHRVCQTNVDCKIELGTANLSIGEFVHLNNGDVIRLEQPREQDLKLHIVNRPKFTGQPALRGNKLVFKITERLEA